MGWGVSSSGENIKEMTAVKRLTDLHYRHRSSKSTCLSRCTAQTEHVCKADNRECEWLPSPVSCLRVPPNERTPSPSLHPSPTPSAFTPSEAPHTHLHPQPAGRRQSQDEGKCQHLLRRNSFRLRSRSHVTTVENHCDWISKPTAGIVWLTGRG